MFTKERDPERRYKLLSVTPVLMMQAIVGRGGAGSVVPTITADGLPEGYEIHGIHFHFERQVFQLLVHHPSFDPVEIAATIPYANVRVSVKYPEPAEVAHSV